MSYTPVRDEESDAWVVVDGPRTWPFSSWTDANERARQLQARDERSTKTFAGSIEYLSPRGSRVRFRKDRFNWVRRDGSITHKEFRYLHQPQPPEGVWVRRMPECASRTLYRLPELTAALAGGRGSTVYWCEGESDADAVAAELDLSNPPPGPDLDHLRQQSARSGRGMDGWRRAVEHERKRVARWWKAAQAEGWPAAATAHHGGAVHVTAEQAALFRGFRGRIVVVADLDEPGAADAVVRRGLLVDVAGMDRRRVTVAAPAAGKDARDHLRAGNGLAGLREADERGLRRTARAYLAEKQAASEARGYLRTNGAAALVELYSQKRAR